MSAIQLKSWKKDQVLTYLLGCFLFSIGAKFFIDSKLGVDPLDVLCIGITLHAKCSMGIASGIIAIVFLSIWSIWNRKFPPLAPFFTTFIVGCLIDLWNYIRVEEITYGVLNPFLILGIGLFICSYASSLIIMSGIGIRIMDLVAITIVQKWNWQFYSAKIFLEVALFGVGWILGGPVGIGTLAFLCFVGPLIQPFMFANHRYLNLPNYGLGRPAYATS